MADMPDLTMRRNPSNMLKPDFQVGDLLTVVCKEDANAYGWCNAWASEMDNMVGNSYEIECVLLDGQIGLENSQASFVYCFPWWCLDEGSKGSASTIAAQEDSSAEITEQETDKQYLRRIFRF